jgi:hypothetical protein
LDDDEGDFGQPAVPLLAHISREHTAIRGPPGHAAHQSLKSTRTRSSKEDTGKSRRGRGSKRRTSALSSNSSSSSHDSGSQSSGTLEQGQGMEVESEEEDDDDDDEEEEQGSGKAKPKGKGCRARGGGDVQQRVTRAAPASQGAVKGGLKLQKAAGPGKGARSAGAEELGSRPDALGSQDRAATSTSQAGAAGGTRAATQKGRKAGHQASSYYDSQAHAYAHGKRMEPRCPCAAPTHAYCGCTLPHCRESPRSSSACLTY